MTTAVEEAQKNGIYAWAYDENGWPSGFGNGIVPGFGEEYQQKYLRVETQEVHTDTQIYHDDSLYFYYEINPFYSDSLNAEASRMFVREVYQPYYEKYGSALAGFFTDEPQLSRNGIPWSHVLPKAYADEYSEELFPLLKELFYKTGNYRQTRIRFWRIVTKLFSENFMKVLYDFCDERGLKLTGHLVAEETLQSQLTANGACMPHYEYFHIPGIDWLGRNISECLTAYQVSSAAQQLGKSQVLSETFALCGHNVSFDELKGIHEWNMVRGITLLCQHLEGYSLRGIRKRDYPPAMYYQQPWWNDYKPFNDAMSRIGALLSEGDMECDTLVIHPQSSAWAAFDDEADLNKLNSRLLSVIRALEQKHIAFHLGDEILMEQHGCVVGGTLIIGKCKYSKVIVSHCVELFDSTKRLIDSFIKEGGKVVEASDLPNNNICAREIAYAKRSANGFTAHYFVNSSLCTVESKINVQGKVLDIVSGKLHAFSGVHSFEPYGSLMVIEDGSMNVISEKPEKRSLDLSGEWDITSASENVLTLDFCDYYFDGELQEENGYVLNIANRANGLKRRVQLHQDYRVNIAAMPETLYLVCETPESFQIKVNGAIIDKTDCGYFRDISFRKINITKYIRNGDNVISFDCDFGQSQSVYESLEKAEQFESEKNKLVYDMEVEPIYLVGHFSIATDGSFEALQKGTVRYTGGFSIDKAKKKLLLNHIEQQGFPFFAGEITLSKELVLNHTDYVLSYNKAGINVIKVKINGISLPAAVLWGSAIEISIYLHAGINKIELTLINNLRNMLGPHHLEIGESYLVTPALFYKEECVWSGWSPDDSTFNKNYCFASVGIESK